MKNVYNIRTDKNLYFILPDNCIESNDTLCKENSIAVIVNLYYTEYAKWYLNQLYAISAIADIYVISSNLDILNMVSDKKIHLIEKKNRGRDISALLVSSKKIFLQYDYVCFLHDKKAGYDSDILRVKLWAENMWHNLIRSKDYIRNVITLFQKNENIGLLVPPEPSSFDWYIWGRELWRNNYKNTKNICSEWNLNCGIDPQIPPITIGTVFWCRTNALRKLFERDWKYEDFQDEPLPNDGTISHAIERVLAYVAQDAGYDTGTIVCPTYAAKQLLQQQEYIAKMFDILNKSFDVNTFEKVERFRKQNDYIQKFCNKHKKIYLYGAGIIGNQCLSMLRNLRIRPEAVIESKIGTKKNIDGIPIVSFSMIDDLEAIGIIISVGFALKEEIINLLEEKDFHNYICYVDIKKME